MTNVFITTRHTPSKCPVCGQKITASTSYDNNIPKEGDISICIACGTILTYTKSLRVRIATQAEIGRLENDQAERLRQFAQSIRELHGKKSD